MSNGDQETAVEMALRERNTAEQELESMKIATHQQVCQHSVIMTCYSCLLQGVFSNTTPRSSSQPAAVALRFDVDFETLFKDSAGLGSFIAQLQEDICSAVEVPRATVQVLCFKKGSMMSVAEVLLNKVIDHSYPVSVDRYP